jgi:methyl halide transferase
MENETVEACCVVSCDRPLDQNYWNSQYESKQIGWDLGQVSPPLKGYIDQLATKNLRILIMGCGNAYEADYLLDNGFQHITLIDISPLLVESLQQKYKGRPEIVVVLGDFFEHHGQYDLVLEQTFFCAINPSLRQSYANKMNEIIVPQGKLVGVMFDKEFDFAGPPFGGCKCKYEGYFTPYFSFKIFEHCHNSIKPRQDTELFVNFIHN